MDSNMPELDRKALKEALDVALLDLEAAASPTKAEVFIRCGTGAGDLRDAIVSLRASLEEAEGRLEEANLFETENNAAFADLDARIEELTARAEAAEQRERRLREALTVAEPLVETLHSTATHPEVRASLWAKLTTIRAALSEEEA